MNDGGATVGAGLGAVWAGPRGTNVWHAPSRHAAANAIQRLALPPLTPARLRASHRLCHDLSTMPEPLSPGLYIVATPIGNLGDLSPRAADVLARADVLAVEDSRVTAGLLRHIGVKRPMIAYHDHNAEGVRPGLVARLAGEAVALVSDAGTPLISDPGYKLVRDARAAGHAVVTIPGPCAAVAALTLAGLPTDRFLFLGFLPPKAHARATAIAEIATVRAHAGAIRKWPPPSRLPDRAERGARRPRRGGDARDKQAV